MAMPATGWRGQPSRHLRGYGAQWVKTRAIIARRDNHLCQPCQRKGQITPFHAVDHITPKSKGGTDDHDNLECVCHACHLAKTTAESMDAQGRKAKKIIGPDGWPVS